MDDLNCERQEEGSHPAEVLARIHENEDVNAALLADMKRQLERFKKNQRRFVRFLDKEPDHNIPVIWRKGDDYSIGELCERGDGSSFIFFKCGFGENFEYCHEFGQPGDLYWAEIG